jgi:hypothetical protein
VIRSIACALCVAAVLVPLAGAVEAQAPPVPPAAPSAPVPVPPNDPAVQATMPGCAAWTDRCVTCERADGKVTCSNIGIACQPEALICLRPEPAATPAPAPAPAPAPEKKAN